MLTKIAVHIPHPFFWAHRTNTPVTYWLTPTSPQCPSSRPASVPPTACPHLTHFNSLSSFPLHILLTAELSTSLQVHYSRSQSTHSLAQCRQRKMHTGVPHRRMQPSYACAAPRWQAQNKLHVVRSASCRLTQQTSLVSVASIFSARPPSAAAASSPQILVPLLQASSPQVLAPLLLHLLHKSLLYCCKHLLHKSLLHCCCIFSTGPCSVAAASSPQVLAPLLQASSLQDLPARPASPRNPRLPRTHTSGAIQTDALAPHSKIFSLHFPSPSYNWQSFHPPPLPSPTQPPSSAFTSIHLAPHPCLLLQALLFLADLAEA